MRKMTLLLALAFTLVALPAFAATPAADTAPEAAPAVEELMTPAVDVDTTCANATAELDFEVMAWACPYGSPTCNTHDDCDAYCGHPDFGNCEFRHWTGCCVCLG